MTLSDDDLNRLLKWYLEASECSAVKLDREDQHLFDRVSDELADRHMEYQDE